MTRSLLIIYIFLSALSLKCEDFSKYFWKYWSFKMRLPTDQEYNLIKELIFLSKKDYLYIQLENLMVAELEDGKMGSLSLMSNGIQNKGNKQIELCSEKIFKDVDEVTVIASLYIDVKGNLYELDIWKVDYSPIISLPWFTKN